MGNMLIKEGHKKTEKKFVMTAGKLEKLLQNVPGVLFQYIMFHNNKHGFPYVSRNIEEFLGIPSALATADPTSIIERIHPDDMQSVAASIHDAASNLVSWRHNFRIFNSGRNECWIEVAATPTKLPNGDLLWSGYAMEVNERKILESDLREAQEALLRLSEERTEKLLEANAKLSSLNNEIKAEIKERIQLEKNLKESYDLLSSLAENLVRSEERARRKIAVQLHDNVVQHLALGKLRLDSGIRNRISPMELLKQQSMVMVEAMQQIREICNDLSPPVLHDFGLAKALSGLAATLVEKSAAPLTLQCNLEEMDLPETLLSFLYQTARELLVNAIKHSSAEHIRIGLKKYPNKCGALIRLTVEDDGTGFATDSIPGFGLSNIEQRVLFHKGQLSITSTPEMRTSVTVEIPEPAKQ